MWAALLLGIFGGWKQFFGVLLMGFIAIIFYNLFVEIIGELLDFVLGKINEGTGSVEGGIGAAQLGTFAAWIAIQLRVIDCLALATAAVSGKWLVRKIPFIRW